MAFTWKTTDIWKGEGIYHLSFVVAERRPLLGELVALDDVTRPDVPGYADKLEGDDRDVLKLRPGITGPATLKYRLEGGSRDRYLIRSINVVGKIEKQCLVRQENEHQPMCTTLSCAA